MNRIEIPEINPTSMGTQYTTKETGIYNGEKSLQ